MIKPRFTSRDEYGKVFTDAACWRPYVEAVCARHGLGPCRQIQAGLPGTHPVFRVDSQFVVKFYTHLFGGSRSFHVERELYTLFAREPGIPAPMLIAVGELFPGDDEWPWPYLVTNAVPGRSFGEERPRVSEADCIRVARFLGPVLRRLHALPLGHSPTLPGTWDDFVAFLQVQRSMAAANHARWGTLPERLIAQLDSYLPPVESLIEWAAGPHLLHADLNEDHVLGVFEGGRWRTTGIIDFGDARVGDRLYELVALHLGLFRGDKRQLRAFLDAYGFDAALQDRFVHRAMSYTLLHEFDVLPVFRSSPEAAEIETLAELADWIWKLDEAGLASK